MTCPHCKNNNADIETKDFIERKHVDGVNYRGFDEKYNVICPKCGKRYIHTEQYEIVHDGTADRPSDTLDTYEVTFVIRQTFMVKAGSRVEAEKSARDEYAVRYTDKGWEMISNPEVYNIERVIE